MEKFKIIFIIANWNRKALLSRCLDSISAYISVSHKIITVDNASSDGSQDMVREKYPYVFLIENSENLGYSRANNLALKKIREEKIDSDYVIFLNNDVLFKDNSLERLIDYLNIKPEYVAAIPTVFQSNIDFQTGIGGYELSLSSAFAYFFFLSILFPRIFKGFYFHQKYFRKKKLIAELDWISGVCFVVRNQVFENISGFPESFFMYAEDVAFSKSVKALGKIVYFPRAQVYHIKEDSIFQSRQGMWLDSIFQYYKSIIGAKGRRGKLILLKIIFLLGLWLRLMLRGRFKENKKLYFYCIYIVKSLFKEY